LRHKISISRSQITLNRDTGSSLPFKKIKGLALHPVAHQPRTHDRQSPGAVCSNLLNSFQPSIDFTWPVWRQSVKRRSAAREISPDMHTAIMLGANRGSSTGWLHFHLHDTSWQTNKQTKIIIIIIIKGEG